MASFTLFQYERFLLHMSRSDTLRVIGESTENMDTWSNHDTSSDAYSVAYREAISGCTRMIVDFKGLTSFDVIDHVHFVPNLNTLVLNDCTLLRTANLAFPNLTSLSISNTQLNDSVLRQLPIETKALILVDVSHTRHITHVPSAETINIGHSMVTSIDPAISDVHRIVANDARLTSLRATALTSVILWSYPGRSLTISGATSALTVLTPQSVDSVVSSANTTIIPISYFGM